MTKQSDLNSSLWTAIIIVLLAALTIGIFAASYDNSQSATSTEVVEQIDQVNVYSNEDGTIVNYSGVIGKTALELLKAGAEVETQDSSYGEYVVAINGVKNSGQFWLFYVNGAAATVGAGEYVTTNGETIEWRLE